MTERLFLDKLRNWAELQTDIYTILLVGSQARGDAKPDSDVDLVIICRRPEHYLNDIKWVHVFGIPARKDFEDWGKVTSLRVWFEGGLEVEFAITDEEWVRNPLDAGTKKTLDDGYLILFDRTENLPGIFARDKGA